MRSIRRTEAFKRDLKRESTGEYRIVLKEEFLKIVEALASDIPLPAQRYDHALIGNRAGYRECHIRPDLLLLYRKPDESTLELIRLGSHSEILD